MLSPDRIRVIVDARWFQTIIIGLILANAFLLGLETSPWFLAEHGEVIHALDAAVLWVFVVELSLRIYGHRAGFFRDPWSWFDLIVVAIALLPSTGPFAVMRVLRILRVLRLLSVIPSLRHVVTGLFRAMPGMASISFLVALLLYVAAVMSTNLFRETAPQHFGDVFASLFTLFQIMTGDNWGEIARGVMGEQPLAWVFFVTFILASTFIALNLFIAVAVEALEHDGGDRSAEVRRGHDPDRDQDAVLAELRALRAEVAELRARAGSSVSKEAS
ncbi:ion transporter [Nocardiopsis gilva YIM 90087]|uniref:Ion transporter n=1 Tax=Nocardiopsis gilva YIM 90087 TaxID=1235441 RepID=A0A223SCV3_9ACTN|nr:ion transporter [Nocardiopsis gilva]ASU85913.1 ion transporter [Nocardiopsis gilva YIM 90087]